MPFSPTLRLVHVAIPKTGSTSVIRALRDMSRQAGVTLLLYQDVVNNKFRKVHEVPNEGLGPWPNRSKHLSARQLRAVLGKDYDEAFSFSFTRNPWARTISRYRFTHVSNRPGLVERMRRRTNRTFHDLSFKEWVRVRVDKVERRGRVRNQIDKLTDESGEIIVDFVGKLESVQEDFARVCERIGQPTREVPHVNSTSREHYSRFYTDWTREAVAELYARDIETFGYEFESN